MDALNTMASSIEIRGLAARDSMQALTELLHRAYAPLAGRGMNFTAATQSAETTARRAAEGHCFIAERRGRVVGTVTVCGPYEVDTAPWAANVPAFRDRDTAHFVVAQAHFANHHLLFVGRCGQVAFAAQELAAQSEDLVVHGVAVVGAQQFPRGQ